MTTTMLDLTDPAFLLLTDFGASSIFRDDITASTPHSTTNAPKLIDHMAP